MTKNAITMGNNTKLAAHPWSEYLTAFVITFSCLYLVLILVGNADVRCGPGNTYFEGTGYYARDMCFSTPRFLIDTNPVYALFSLLAIAGVLLVNRLTTIGKSIPYQLSYLETATIKDLQSFHSTLLETSAYRAAGEATPCDIDKLHKMVKALEARNDSGADFVPFLELQLVGMSKNRLMEKLAIQTQTLLERRNANVDLKHRVLAWRGLVYACQARDSNSAATIARRIAQGERYENSGD